MGSHVPSLAKRGVRRLLNSRFGLARLATVGNNAQPHVVPTWFLHRNGRIYIPSPSTTLKAKHLTKNPNVSVIIDSYSGVLAAQGILLEGKAHIVRGTESSKINRAVHEKYVGARRLKQKKWLNFMAEDDITIAVEPRKIKSWDFNRLKL